MGSTAELLIWTQAPRIHFENRTRLNPRYDLLASPRDVSRDLIRKRVARLYDMLPGLMRAYAFHLERFSKFNKASSRG
jgi:hypothetical protein